MVGPEWASVNLGIVFCANCAGLHRGLGVNISFVRSVSIDVWKPEQISFMEHGGNSRLREFLTSRGEDLMMPIERKYRTPGAELYRQQLKARVAGEEEPMGLSPDALRELEEEMEKLTAQAQKASKPKAMWTPDKAQDVCELCRDKFTVINRRHHCRRCGKLVCKKCAPSNNSRPIPEWNLPDPVRHCKECYKSPTVFKDVRVGKLN